MSIPVMPSTHTWVQLGPGFSKTGNTQGGGVALFVGDDADVWVWDEDTNTRVTDLRDASGNPVTSVPVHQGWLGDGNPPGVGVPVAVAVPSFSVGQFGKRMASLPVQTLRNASAALAPTDAGIKTAISNPASQSGSYLNATFETPAGAASKANAAAAPKLDASVAASTYAPQQVGGMGLARTVNRADYASFSAAKTAAGAGGTIFFPDGTTWDEPAITLDGPITLDARRATIRKTANGPAITITGQGVILNRGLTIEGMGTVYTGPTISITGNGTSQDTEIDAKIINSDGPCVDVGIGAAQRGRFRSSMATTRQRQVTDGVTTAASTTVTSATAAFVAGDVGKAIFILGAYLTAQPTWYFLTRITTVNSATSVTVADAVPLTVSGATMQIHAPVYRFAAEVGAGVNGDRSISGTYTSGCVLVDFGGAQTINVTDTNSRGVIFSSSSCVKVSLSGSNRLATTGAPTVVRGTQQAITGAMIAGDVILDTNASDCTFAGNVTAGSVTDKGIRNIVNADSLPTLPRTLDPRLYASNTALNANQAVYLRATGRGWISKIGLHVGAASGNVCVGVYSNNSTSGNGARPSALKGSSGSVACPAAGYAEVALTSPVFVQEGDWIAVAADNATATFGRGGAAGFGSSLANGLSHHQSSSFPLPATASPSAGSIYSVILVGVA